MVICKVMQDYCPEVKNEELLKLGLRWYDELEASEAATVCARNPHELMRTLEAFSVMDSNRMILHASLARKSSSTFLNLKRQDYPVLDPPEWNHWVTILSLMAKSGQYTLQMLLLTSILYVYCECSHVRVIQ